MCFELADRILKSMAGGVTVVDEVHGFKFFDNRDLLGFVDGTENPGARLPRATAIGDEDPDFAGFVLRHMCKSTCTTCGHGSRCRSAIRSG